MPRALATLGAVHSDGLFEEGSIARRVNSEAVLLLGGGRALLMQLAHPSVAAGVAQHSDFEAAPLRRLLRTLRFYYAPVFGTPRQAEAAAAHLGRVHARVTGPGYVASDPALLLWVHATLVDTALEVYGRFVRPLERSEREAYYLEMRRVLALHGVAREDQPPDLAAFEAHVASMVAGLEVTPDARAVASSLFAPGQIEVRPLGIANRWLTSGLLPPRLREAYGLRWSPVEARVLAGLEACSRAALPWLPSMLRRPPPMLMPAKPAKVTARG